MRGRARRANLLSYGLRSPAHPPRTAPSRGAVSRSGSRLATRTSRGAAERDARPGSARRPRRSGPGVRAPGLRSSSATSGSSSARSERRRRRSTSAASSAGGAPRKPATSRPALPERTSSCASTSVSGASRNCASPMSSASTPPGPNATSGPNTGSCTAPARSSAPPRTNGCTSTGPPSCSAAARTASSSPRSRITPPCSVLCAPATAVLRTTGKPISRAASTAASGVGTTLSATSGTPYASSRRRVCAASSQASSPSASASCSTASAASRSRSSSGSVPAGRRSHSPRSTARPSAFAAASGYANDGTFSALCRPAGGALCAEERAEHRLAVRGRGGAADRGADLLLVRSDGRDVEDDHRVEGRVGEDGREHVLEALRVRAAEHVDRVREAALARHECRRARPSSPRSATAARARRPRTRRRRGSQARRRS